MIPQDQPAIALAIFKSFLETGAVGNGTFTVASVPTPTNGTTPSTTAGAPGATTGTLPSAATTSFAASIGLVVVGASFSIFL